MRNRYFCPLDRCIFTALMTSPEHEVWPRWIPCAWADVTLEPSSIHLLCVGSPDGSVSVSTSCVLQHKPSKATLKVTLIVTFFHARESQMVKMQYMEISMHILLHTYTFDFGHLRNQLKLKNIRDTYDQSPALCFLLFGSMQCFNSFFLIFSRELLRSEGVKFKSVHRVWGLTRCREGRWHRRTYQCSPGCQRNALHSLPALPFDKALAPAQTWPKVKN